jgi:hypothetical protein
LPSALPNDSDSGPSSTTSSTTLAHACSRSPTQRLVSINRRRLSSTNPSRPSPASLLLGAAGHCSLSSIRECRPTPNLWVRPTKIVRHSLPMRPHGVSPRDRHLAVHRSTPAMPSPTSLDAQPRFRSPPRLLCRPSSTLPVPRRVGASSSKRRATPTVSSSIRHPVRRSPPLPRRISLPMLRSVSLLADRSPVPLLLPISIVVETTLVTGRRIFATLARSRLSDLFFPFSYRIASISLFLYHTILPSFNSLVLLPFQVSL